MVYSLIIQSTEISFKFQGLSCYNRHQMSSPCLSGGGRAYGFDFELVKSPSITSSRTSYTSSPSSTLSEASNSPLTISTRKPRTPRKRPNQTYNEAAAILSTAYPNIFSYNNHLSSSRKFTKPPDILLLDDPSELLLPFRVFDNSGFLISQPIREKTLFVNEPKVTTPTSCDKSWQSNESSMELCEDDLDAESILDEEIEEGIDSIMGNAADARDIGVGNDGYCNFGDSEMNPSCWYGYPMGYNFGIGFTKGVRALRHADHGNFLDFPIVDMFQISPRLNNNKNDADSNKNGSHPNSNSGSKPKLSSSAKKKKKKVEKPVVELKRLEIAKESITTTEEEEENSLVSKPNDTAALLLKLNYDDVLNAWSDRGSPFSEEFEGNDVSARLAQIDLFTEGGMREASVLRYKEKRRTRLFSKKIRYQVRKVNADRRPRMKGRFVRRPNSSANTLI